MSEARIGRLVAASLHQAIADELPQRLEFYEHWLQSKTLRDGTIGLAPLTAVLGFLRIETEADAYGRIMRRAGTLAAEWTLASSPAASTRALSWLPRALRARAAMRVVKRLVRDASSASRASGRVRRGRVTLEVRSSLFCAAREAKAPLCAFYLAAATAVLKAFGIPAHGQLVRCHALDRASGCTMTIDLADVAVETRLAAALAWGMLGLAAPAHAQIADGSRVLVMPFGVEVAVNAQGGPGAALWLGEAAALLVADDLAAHGVRALERDERVAAFDRLQVPMSASLTRATVIRVAELMGATEVVYGDLSLAQGLTVTARVIRLGVGQQSPDVIAQGDLPQLFQLFDRLAEQLIAASRRSGKPLGRDPDLPLEVLESYVKGLVAAAPGVQRKFLESALARAPHDARTLLALWEVYTTAGEHERALGAASAVAPTSPRSRRARFASAQSLIALRRLDGAFSTLQALQAEQSHPAIANALGIVHLRRTPADLAAASAAFRRAVDGEPGLPDYLFNLGYSHALARATEPALGALREAVRYDAADGAAHLLMGAILSGAGRRAEAHREYELARLLGDASESDVLALPATIPAGLERLTARLDGPVTRDVLAAPAQRDQAAAAEFHLQEGRRLFAAGRDRDALDQLRRAAYLTPYADQPHLLIGRIHHRAGRLADAVDEFKVALWCRESVAGLLALAAAELESGDRPAARRSVTRALVLEPGSSEARALLARIDSGVPRISARVLPSGGPG